MGVAKQQSPKVDQNPLARQLWAEYQQLCRYYQLKMPPVAICIANNLHYAWATYQADVRLITVSAQLVANYPWAVVVEVLKHEMAHHWLSWQMPASFQRTHGLEFKAVCQRLGMPAWAMQACGELPQAYAATTQFSERSGQQKIDKLLRLAQSTNPYEAKLARQLANKLQQQQLQNDGENWHSQTIVCQGQRGSQAEKALVGLLGLLFEVGVVYTQTFDSNLLQQQRALDVLGTTTAVTLAAYFFNVASRQLDKLWLNYRQQHQQSPGKAQFQLGLVIGLQQKLLPPFQQAANDKTTQHIVRIRTISLAQQRFVKQRYPQLSSSSTSQTRYMDQSYCDGISQGKQLHIAVGLPITKNKQQIAFLNR